MKTAVKNGTTKPIEHINGTIHPEGSSFSHGGHRVMRFEVYVGDGELGQIFEDLFGLFHKYVVSIQRTQKHVLLSKEEKKPREEDEGFVTSGTKGLALEKTNLYGSPPDNVDALRRVLEGNSLAKRDEARRLEDFYAVH
jgi:hypothetical protein